MRGDPWGIRRGELCSPAGIHRMPLRSTADIEPAPIMKKDGCGCLFLQKGLHFAVSCDIIGLSHKLNIGSRGIFFLGILYPFLGYALTVEFGKNANSTS